MGPRTRDTERAQHTDTPVASEVSLGATEPPHLYVTIDFQAPLLSQSFLPVFLYKEKQV